MYTRIVVPYAATQLSPQMRDLLATVQTLVELVPDVEFPDLRCHELARAMGGALDVPFVDGMFGAVEHTWLVPAHEVILDPYFPGVLPQVVLIDAWVMHPLSGLYVPGEPRDDIDEEIVHRLRLAWGE